MHSSQIKLASRWLGIALLALIPLLIRRTVDEKRNRMSDLLRSMGLDPIHYWISVWIDYFQFIFIICFFAAVLYKIPFKSSALGYDTMDDYPSVMHLTSFTLWLFLLIMIAFQVTSFSAFIATLFKSPTMATFVSIVVLIVSKGLVALLDKMKSAHPAASYGQVIKF